MGDSVLDTATDARVPPVADPFSNPFPTGVEESGVEEAGDADVQGTDVTANGVVFEATVDPRVPETSKTDVESMLRYDDSVVLVSLRALFGNGGVGAAVGGFSCVDRYGFEVLDDTRVSVGLL